MGKSICPNLGVGISIFFVENIYPCPYFHSIVKFFKSILYKVKQKNSFKPHHSLLQITTFSLHKTDNYLVQTKEAGKRFEHLLPYTNPAQIVLNLPWNGI